MVVEPAYSNIVCFLHIFSFVFFFFLHLALVVVWPFHFCGSFSKTLSLSLALPMLVLFLIASQRDQKRRKTNECENRSYVYTHSKQRVIRCKYMFTMHIDYACMLLQNSFPICQNSFPIYPKLVSVALRDHTCVCRCVFYSQWKYVFQ